MTLAVIKDFPSLALQSTRDVSGFSSRCPVRLTQSGLADGDSEMRGRLIFLRDVDATFAPVERSVLWRRKDADGVSGSYLRWFRVEIQAKAGKGADIKCGMEAVLSRDPGAGWFAAMRFKSSSHKTELERGDPLVTPCVDENEVFARLESLKWDYWETGSFVTAGISVPPDAHIEARNYSRGDWRFGVCGGVEEAVAALRKDPRVRELQKLTEHSALRFSPRLAADKKPIPEEYCNFHNELKEHAALLLELALRQALAGPEDGAAWHGCPVADLVAEIYKDHMYRVNRQLVDRDKEVSDYLGQCNDALEREQRRQGWSPRGGNGD